MKLGDITKFLKENEVAVNNCGDGKVAAIGIGPSGEPGVKRKPKAKKKTLRGVISAVNVK